MNNKDLTSKYGSVLYTLKALKVYTVLIIMLGIISFISGIPNIGLFLLVLSTNCCMNYMLFSKICKYFEMLNVLMEESKDAVSD